MKKLVEELKPNVYFDAVSGPSSSRIIKFLPANSTVYVYGNLSGQPLPVETAPLFRPINITGFYLTNWVKE